MGGFFCWDWLCFSPLGKIIGQHDAVTISSQCQGKLDEIYPQFFFSMCRIQRWDEELQLACRISNWISDTLHSVLPVTDNDAQCCFHTKIVTMEPHVYRQLSPIVHYWYG